MGWLPQAIREDVGAPGQFSNGPMWSYTGIVLHVNDAMSGDLFGWITSSHDAGRDPMSCHFQVVSDGTIYQYVDTQYSAWCQGAGNDNYLSIETEGLPSDPLTAAQLKSCGLILAYVHASHGIPLVVTDTVGEPGFIAHGDGGLAWGGHPECPGVIRKAQRTDILALAAPPPEVDLTPAESQQLAYVYEQIRGGVGNGQTTFDSTFKATLATTQAQFNQLNAISAALKVLEAKK